MLERHALDEPLGDEWRKLHSAELRRLESCAFRLAQIWFGCGVAAAVQEEIDSLLAGTRGWFDEFASSPATRSFHPNKDELWLHLSLLSSRRDSWIVAGRKILPGRLPGPLDAVYVPDNELTPW